jgi:pyridoxal phosphate-dependent aminotransferase EpsN
MCAYTGAEAAVALSSGTAALHLALLLAGVQAGDEVLVSSLTFAAPANAVTYLGAVPTFIDCERETWNMDPELLGATLADRAAVDRLPAAVIVVDIYGQCAQLDRIVALCDQYGVPIVEDAAEALGATWQGRHAGTWGATAAFSFNGNKIITTSGGGMLASHDGDLMAHARKLAPQAREDAPYYEHVELGYNYRMSSIAAAIGRGQLSVLEDRVRSRRRIFKSYRQRLGTVPGITFMPEAEHSLSNRWLTVVLIDPEAFGATPEQVRLALEAKNIEARPVWKPMHMQPVFRNCRLRKASDEPKGEAVSEELFRRGLCLPSGSAMTERDIDRVVDAILDAIGGLSHRTAQAA